MIEWTEERIALLKKLWAEGLSASEVARRFDGATRNSVIGKVHRLGLGGRVVQRAPKPVGPRGRRRAQAPRPAWMSAPYTDARPLEPIKLDDGRSATLLSLNERLCKFPIGDPNATDFAFCGRDVACGPYCAAHARLAYRPRRAH
jgi:GcrA cell cycle regulator